MCLCAATIRFLIFFDILLLWLSLSQDSFDNFGTAAHRSINGTRHYVRFASLHHHKIERISGLQHTIITFSRSPGNV